MIFRSFIRKGDLKRWLRGLLLCVGATFVWLGLEIDIFVFTLIGMVVESVGMYAAKVAMTNAKPSREK
ncbi:hypothetical protein [Achromobacter ruhlandii]|uniref:hypothetical protein n=1 Tax=Achromobacter ruhlandii TaxID=72557 RepID=UPI000AEC2CB8|nr:hypothetical protein [Achromobacter ruhlandii]